ncbi:hypothetical protein CJD36_000925 [Flavipsychrobacter stenotrophus]|uniref:Peptidase S24/S26A/S26B/S26C domain-containing protein n=1 Tax=Flavipsychrobacter stenotrophus TaxID=2077091 RepID=A0A2S7SZH1_9BACT|nr:S24 family peptidase [Flavipsychrobacter stenotrophus]PQJ12349.1 hypothetical protein CJD36_000925 [Flavipsychrobacter stenotrophus]
MPVKATAGYLTGYGDVDFINALPSYTLPFLSREKSYRSFQTDGDSMYPFPEKAIIIGEYVDDWFSLKDNFPCIVVTLNEGIVFKLVSNRIDDERTVRLTSLNPAYKPYDINVSEICEIWKYKCFISDTIFEVPQSIDLINNSINEIKHDIKNILKKHCS